MRNLYSRLSNTVAFRRLIAAAFSRLIALAQYFVFSEYALSRRIGRSLLEESVRQAERRGLDTDSVSRLKTLVFNMCGHNVTRDKGSDGGMKVVNFASSLLRRLSAVAASDRQSWLEL